MITLFYDDSSLAHDTGPGHPECPQRVSVILDKLMQSELAAQLRLQSPPAATDEQILLAHSERHLQYILRSVPDAGRVALDPDTSLSPGSLQAARHCVGAACQGVDMLMRGKTRQVFCLGRPPGHHATRDSAMGFCLFNQIAIAALYAQKEYALERIAIVDFDVHHGNGTQDIVLGHKGLFYLSTHQSPFYPGTGHASENQSGRLCNIPLAAGTDDEQYSVIFREQVLPALRQYRPQLLLVSAGFDAHKDDPLAAIRLTENSYHAIGRQLAELAAEHCEGRMLSVLEGGYNLQVLGASVAAYLQGIISADSD